MSKGKVKLVESTADKNSYNISMSGKDENFIVDKRYELIDMIGSGAYGIVCAAKDHGDLDENG
jgi:hypothetical protein